MKLYDVKPGSTIRVLGEIKTPPGSLPIVETEILTFHHLDGMYSYCTNKDKKSVHLVAWAEVEVVTN